MSEKPFCGLLNDAIDDEAKAKEFYEKLRKAWDESWYKSQHSPETTDLIHSLIGSIADTEEKIHKKALEQLKSRICEGVRPPP